MTSIDEKYAQEVAQSDLDHHKPTAGAMSGHILANLKVEETKLAQARFYVKGSTSESLKTTFLNIEQNERDWFEELAQQLLIEGELIPTTTEEFVRYNKVTESGKNKYFTTADMIWSLVTDFDFQNLFVTRAIKLAEKEEKFALQQSLIQHLAFNKKVIFDLQSLLDHTAKEGLMSEEEDDDED